MKVPLISRMLTALSPCPSSKHALGSHEYIQYCRKFDIDIRLQLMEQKAVRSDLARTVRVCWGGGGLHGMGRWRADGDTEHAAWAWGRSAGLR